MKEVVRDMVRGERGNGDAIRFRDVTRDVM